MQHHDTEFGRVEVTTLPLPENLGEDVNGTYTYSGRVLVSVREPEKDKDWYRVFTIEDNGDGLCEVFAGIIPQKKGANGIRWMCFSDNRRILLGDYVIECEPDLDHCEHSRLLEVVFPEEITQIPGIFMRWSEPIIAPDGEHVCFSSLTMGSAFNFLGRLVCREDDYVIEDARVISTVSGYEPDLAHPGCFRQTVQRGGEVKQFVRGGLGITLAGGGRSLSESCLQMLDSDEVFAITDTLGYEETAILSPNERYAVCMSPRFSPRTDAGLLGVVPLSGDLPTRGRYLNVLYQYAIAGVRSHRPGNIGPALINVKRSLKEGRSYKGVDLSDPEGKWVYYSPMSWHPDSTKALWNEKTRLNDAPVRCRLRICRLLDKKPSEPVTAVRTPDPEAIPYSEPISAALTLVSLPMPLVVCGVSGTVTNCQTEDGFFETRYENYSEDGKSFYDGFVRVKSPSNMFMPGAVAIQSRITVSGEHHGQTDFSLVWNADSRFQVFPDFTLDENGLPKCRGFAEYDGTFRDAADLEP